MNNWGILLSATIALGVTALIGKWFIPYLHKIKYGQNIIEEYGPTWHKNKQGTPTMGGFMFMIGITAALLVALVVRLFTREEGMPFMTYGLLRAIITYVMAVCYGFLGFVDDYIKVVKKRNMGLTSKQKFVMQLLIGTLYLVGLYLADTAYEMPIGQLYIPFFDVNWELGLFYYPIALFVITGFVNAVNLTDGIDGLASSTTFVSAIGLMILSVLASNIECNTLSAALAGGCIGFLVWNFHPAKVFMGDTGSMFLGAMVVGCCFLLNNPLLLILVGILFLIEAGSVMLQVASFKLTGKRIFKMSPIHHHFEMSNYNEVQIVLLFSLVQVVGVALAILSAVL